MIYPVSRRANGAGGLICLSVPQWSSIRICLSFSRPYPSPTRASGCPMRLQTIRATQSVVMTTFCLRIALLYFTDIVDPKRTAEEDKRTPSSAQAWCSMATTSVAPYGIIRVLVCILVCVGVLASGTA